jgi:tRNA-specific 2-thiouridylase
MSSVKEKVVVALSGGVDSSVAAALLLQAGYDCHGVFMITCPDNRSAQEGAKEVAKKLGIELTVLDLCERFEQILDYFFGEYRKGRTPNPCVLCNRVVKFGILWQFAQQAGAKFLATGHYARILSHDDEPGLYQGIDLVKDQSYVLSMVRREVFNHILLPMGEHSKDQARQIAQRMGLGTEMKAESQEICFIPDDDYVALLEQRHPELMRDGDIVDSSGRKLGTHHGIHRYTIGQRRGLRIAMGQPYYVTRLDAMSNTVVLGPKADCMHRRLWAGQVNWLVDEPQQPFQAIVKIRYNDRGKPATVSPYGNSVKIEFNELNCAITPGQLAVFYVEQDGFLRVLGGGWIDRAYD